MTSYQNPTPFTPEELDALEKKDGWMELVRRLSTTARAAWKERDELKASLDGLDQAYKDKIEALSKSKALILKMRTTPGFGTCKECDENGLIRQRISSAEVVDVPCDLCGGTTVDPKWAGTELERVKKERDEAVEAWEKTARYMGLEGKYPDVIQAIGYEVQRLQARVGDLKEGPLFNAYKDLYENAQAAIESLTKALRKTEQGK